MPSGGNLPNPLTLPGYHCEACDVALLKTWSMYVGDLWVATEQQFAGVLRDRLPRQQCPSRPSAAGGWTEHVPPRGA